MRRAPLFALAVVLVLAQSFAPAQRAATEPPRMTGSLPSDLFGEMRWRMIGPHRGGRTKAAAGIPDQPNVFFIGATNGGVWKTTDYGRIWTPIFDAQPTGSIGAIAIAPSDPRVIYVGTGEGLQRPDLSTGDGIYKSTDGGGTWTHLGLRDGQQIPQIIVHPKDPNRLYVAVLGHPYGPNEERGIFRSTDGAKTFEKILYKDENTGGVDIAFDPSDPDTLYAVLWEARQGPWENAAWTGPGSGVFKSTNGGKTWRPLTKGLPTFEQGGLGRIGITVAPSNPKRLFATVEAAREGGLYRSDDAGESWFRVTDNQFIVSRGSDFAEVKVHPQNPDVVFTGSIVAWKSTDGGKTFKAFRGAPGGDDYHRFWINPINPDIILIAADQGAVITVNGGETWSSWYNQPTAQMYHVSTDNAFPYRVCSGQQESGSVCIQSRGDDGRITFREWHPVGVEEYGYVAPDPLDPDIVYGGKVSRYDRRTGQVQNVAPRRVGETFRAVRTAPVLFSPVDPHTLYFGQNVLWKTTNGGRSWTQISPDLTRKTWDVPASVGKYRDADSSRPTQRGVIYTIAPSYVDINTVWAGTDDGLIHVTRDGGKTWKDVTPPQVTPWAKVSLMDAGHSDALTAYAAINTFRLDDLKPHIYRTHDGGKTWTHIASGIPDGGAINAVREDPRRKGLLFAGSERAVYVSFDDGDHWQSLRLNMPAISIRDLVIKDDDLVVGTHGRSFWILDDITPLRQIEARTIEADVHLFKPQQAWRFRWNKNTDTPLPPDEPSGENPPDGALVHYWLKSRASGPVTLEILDVGGKLVRKYSSEDQAESIADEGNVPAYWIRPTKILSAGEGLHRFVWDLHYTPILGAPQGFSIAATYRNTARTPTGPWVQPGTYTVRLTAHGNNAKSYTQPLTVKMDPRVNTPALGLQQQFTLSRRLYDTANKVAETVRELRALRASLRGKAGTEALDKDLAALDGEGGGGRGGGRGGGQPPVGGVVSLSALSGQLTQLLNLLQNADAAPTTQAVAAAEAALQSYKTTMARWERLKK